MKKILVLGGSEKSFPLVKYAKEQGYHVLLCDRNPHNPCRYYVDEFVQVSTTDIDGIIKIGRDESVDGVVSFGSDLMAETAALVGQALGLPANPHNAVATMGHKDRFRSFLRTHGFPSPRSSAFTSFQDAWNHRRSFQLPVIVKPIDSAGSTAVSKIEDWSELQKAFNLAAGSSRSKTVLIEEFITSSHKHMIAGDAFVMGGEVVFWGLLNSHRGLPEYPYLPTGTSSPIFLNEEQISEVKSTVQSVIDALGFRFGGINLELMYDVHGDLYVVEIAARNGGNYIPELLQMATGVNIIGALVEASLDQPVSVEVSKNSCYTAALMLYSKKEGAFKKVELSESIKKNVVETILTIKPGESVKVFDRATHAIGVIFLQFDSLDEQEKKLEQFSEHVSVIVV